MIRTKLDDLSAAAKKDDNVDVGLLVVEINANAQEEEEIFYPAAVLVGEYIKFA